MALVEPNLTLTLKHLATSGCVVSGEQQVAMDHSMPIKKGEAGLKSLVLWGRVTALNGKDYLIAEGTNEALLHDDAIILDSKYYYSQDGVKWLDLQPIDSGTAKRADKIHTVLSGDPARSYEFEEKDPNAPQTPADVEEDQELPKPLIYQIPELAVLKHRIDSINQACGVIPVGCWVPDAFNHLVANRLWSGAAYPDKLEAYQHRTVAPDSRTLAQVGPYKLRGWGYVATNTANAAIHKLGGYNFYYNAREMTWGAMYAGDGVRNSDILFML